MTSRSSTLDREKFGPWALVTGASAGIGQEFARQLAAQGFHLVLAARRKTVLDELGRQLAATYGVSWRSVGVDLSDAEAFDRIDAATSDIDVGLVVSNAGTGIPGEFLSAKRDELHSIVRLNVDSHIDIAQHFGRRFVARGRGGLLLVGALGAREGIPYMANAGATKAFVLSLGEALHVELGAHGVHVTVLIPGPTMTPVLDVLGIEPDALPISPMPVERCVSEALSALRANRSAIIPGGLMRFLQAVVPASLSRSMTAKMFANGLALKAKQEAEGS